MEYIYRPLTQADSDAYLDLMNDKSLAVNAGTVPHPISMEWITDRLKSRREAEEKGELADRGLFEDGRLVAMSGYFFRDHGLEIGYSVHRDHRGRGLATKVAKLAIKLAREHRRTGPVAANYFQDNPASGRVLQKLGFVEYGTEMAKSAAREGEIVSVCTRLQGDVHLCEVQDSDHQALFEFHNDEEAQYQAAGGGAHETLDDFKAFLDRVQKAGAVFCTILKEGAPVGSIASFDRFDKREISYWIGRDYWGQGLASKAVALWLEEFPTPDEGLYARVVKDHPASARVLEKNGFDVVEADRFFSDLRGEEVEELLYRVMPRSAAG